MTMLTTLGATGIDGYAIAVITFLAVSIIGVTLFFKIFKKRYPVPASAEGSECSH